MYLVLLRFGQNWSRNHTHLLICWLSLAAFNKLLTFYLGESHSHSPQHKTLDNQFLSLFSCYNLFFFNVLLPVIYWYILAQTVWNAYFWLTGELLVHFIQYYYSVEICSSFALHTMKVDLKIKNKKIQGYLRLCPR